ncbi:MAG TPA: HAMP domain-containing histidine kinase [Leptolyngbyaceae cyanobacterium M33_DOE_097]|uniref:histidine kinase n=1 Tax=Oscillatoriales cyanobacterium SpSt-418 TaxID=2282169 RepID=A0A7C3KDI8_9CYAN|nr:HAMP domain-containing histidine kinase [Leptolyngbyaceae cyanobacterium M33_DOE_097]
MAVFDCRSYPSPAYRSAGYLGGLDEECDRELALVESLLSLQHIEAGTYSSQLVSVDLQALLPHLIEPFETRAQNQQQTLQVAIDPDLPTLSLDPLAINRVITELLSNACKYTPAGGKICIQASLLKEPSVPYLSNFFQFSISNTGIEIPIEEHNRIFDKFYRIPNNDPWRHGGTGLGLALVKKLVEQMNGVIHIESAAGKTCFLIQLPLILAEATF